MLEDEGIPGSPITARPPTQALLDVLLEDLSRAGIYDQGCGQGTSPRLLAAVSGAGPHSVTGQVIL